MWRSRFVINEDTAISYTASINTFIIKNVLWFTAIENDQFSWCYSLDPLHVEWYIKVISGLLSAYPLEHQYSLSDYHDAFVGPAFDIY